MILSITDGIEVAEHTEPQERCEFLAEFREAQAIQAGYVFAAAAYRDAGRYCTLLARQAE